MDVLPADLELTLCWCAGGASVDVPQGGHCVQVVGGDEGLGVSILGERVSRRGEQGVGGEVIDAGQVLRDKRRAGGGQALAKSNTGKQGRQTENTQWGQKVTVGQATGYIY